MKLGGTFLALLLMLRTVGLLAGGVAILDELATIARLETIAVHSASGALWFVIGVGNGIIPRAHHEKLTKISLSQIG